MLDLFHSKNAQSLGTWVGILTAFFTVVGKLIPEWFGQFTWPQLILLALGAALAFLLILSVAAFLFGAGGALFRRYKPLPGSSNAPEELDPTEEAKRLSRLEHNHSNLRDKFTAFEAETRERQKAIINDYQRMCGLEAKLGDWRQERLNLGTAMEELERRLIASMSLSSDYTRQQIASLYGSLGAVYHRERLRELASYIEQGASELEEPTVTGTVYDTEQWEEWEAKERAWRSILEAWCELSACYVDGVGLKVLTVSEEQYRQGGVAQAGQFPGEGLIAYKAFWARLKNWRNWKGEVERAVHQVAFNGGHAVDSHAVDHQSA